MNFTFTLKESTRLKVLKAPVSEEPEEPLYDTPCLDLKQLVPDEETEVTTDGNISSDSEESPGKIAVLDINDGP